MDGEKENYKKDKAELQNTEEEGVKSGVSDSGNEEAWSQIQQKQEELMSLMKGAGKGGKGKGKGKGKRCHHCGEEGHIK